MIGSDWVETQRVFVKSKMQTKTSVNKRLYGRLAFWSLILLISSPVPNGWRQ
jgi:hypothetical protein